MAFAVWWLDHVSGDCSVVRIYEQVFAVALVGGWLAGSAVGLVITFVARGRSVGAAAIGSIIVALANIGSVAVSAGVVSSVRAADYTLKDTDQLLDFLSGTELDARIQSAHALVERRAGTGLPRLCRILDDTEEDINLRHNAAIALGKICAPPREAGVDVDVALACLSRSLESRDEYLPHSIAEALGGIGDARAVKPLAAFLSDKTRPIHAREEAARALGRIGGDEARAALAEVLRATEDESGRG